MLIYMITSPSGKSYIGVTRQLKRRLRDHATADTPVGRALRKYGDRIEVKVLLYGEADYCYMMEQRLVEAFGTVAPKGYNQTAGGMGGRGLSPEAQARKTAALKAWWGVPQNRARETERRNTPEERQKRSTLASAVWEDPVKRSRHMEARSRPEVKALRGAIMLEVQSRPDVIEKKRAAALAQWSDPERRAKIQAGLGGPKQS